MKKTIISIISVILTANIFTSCNNFFHDLIPNSGDRIVSFYINGQLSSEIYDNEIIVTVPQGVSLDSITPSVQTSMGATLFPVTWDYVSRAFDDDRTFGAAVQIYTGGNMTENVIDMIRSNKDFTRPVLDMPIDFRMPVDFLVIAGLGTVRQYTVRVIIDTGEGKFNSFSFEKFFNPDLTVPRTTGTINDTAKTVTINVMYPVENIASYELIPSFTTNNARVYLEGTEILNNVSVLRFEKPQDHINLVAPNRITQEKTLILKRTGYDDVTYTLIVHFSEDPDTSRAITDFRFIRSRNPLIAADYMATITNSGNTGTINVTVYYSGAKPDELRADFVSPGTVRVNGATQQSGMTFHTFSAPLSYVVTSRDGSNTRTYTVTVNMLPASDPLPQITSFTLDISRNSQLKSNSTALIDHNARLIIIEAAYDGASPPYSLSPQFTATGNVTVNGVSQTSGSTYNNFSGAVTYTVTNPSNPTLRRDYRVEVVFVQALSSVAEITSFVFYKADNPDLIADTTATINQGTGAISARLHFETPGGNRTLIARWSSQGTVDSNGVVKYNMDQRQFYTPVNYRAVSIDGLLQKNYTVTIKEVNTRIYVRQSATGRNDGTNWDNAYVNMPNACNDAELFPDEISKEIWIAEGTYTPTDRGDPVDYLIISANTSYIGGFAGNETTVSGRTNMNNRRATITGDLGGGVRSQRFFYKNNFQGPAAFYIFEELQFTNSSIITDGSAIYLRNLNGIVSLNNLYLYNIDGLSSVISLSCLSADVRNTEFYNITFTNTQGSALYVSAPYTNGFITIDNIKIDGVTNGRGFNLHSYLTQISNSQIINCTSGGSGGGININNYRNVEISNTTIENTSAAFRGGGIYFAKTGVAGTVFSEKLNNVTFRNTVSQIDGGAIFSSGDLNTITIEGCNFYNTQAVSTYSSGGAIRSSSGNLIINNCTFNNTHASWTGGAMLVSGAASVIITNNNFINTSAGNGNAIYFTSGIPSSSVTLNNNNFNGMPNPVLWN